MTTIQEEFNNCSELAIKFGWNILIDNLPGHCEKCINYFSRNNIVILWDDYYKNWNYSERNERNEWHKVRSSDNLEAILIMESQ